MTYATSERGRRDERELRAQYEAHPTASRVLHQFGAWFVTANGVEGLRQGGICAIAAERLWADQQPGVSWEDYLLAQAWMTTPDAADMRDALARGREVHGARKPA